MRVAQIATSAGGACGVGNFAVNLQAAARSVGIQIETYKTFSIPMHDCDRVIVQYGWQLMEEGELRQFCESTTVPTYLFCHHRGVEQFDDVVAGFVTVAKGIVGAVSKPVLDLAHPGWTSPALENREALKRRFGLPLDVPTVGSNGFMMLSKQFPEVLQALLPEAERHAVFVDLISSPWFKGSDEVEAHLADLQKRYPEHLRYGLSYLEQALLNQRLQACDLLWCWTKTASRAYGSGSISDQYGSGTRIVAPAKLQFRHVLELPNTVTCSESIDDLVRTIVAEVEHGNFSRHEPVRLSWDECARQVAEFIG